MIPKIIYVHASELALVAKGPLLGTPETTVVIAGIAEVAIGIAVVMYWRSRWPVYLSLAGFVFLLIGAVVLSPELATHAFNPITLTVSAIFFCLIQLVEFRQIRQEAR